MQYLLPGNNERCIRLEIPWEEATPLQWLSLYPEHRRWYWKARDDSVEVAGVDAVLEVHTDWSGISQTLSRVRAQIPSHPDAGCFCAVQFQPAQEQKTGLFVLPRWECFRSGNRQVLAIHGRADENPGTLLKQLNIMAEQSSARLREVGEPDEPNTPAIISREDLPDRSAWLNTVQKAATSIDMGHLVKVVPARRTTLRSETPVDPINIVDRLKSLNRTGNFIFCYAVPGEKYFIGASPERLFVRVDSMVGTEAIAGTAPRNSDNLLDDNAARHLLASRKNRAEHEIVVRYITEQLETLNITALKEKTRILTLPVCHHLITSLMGNIPEDVTDAQLLTLLHPTPAVAGYPRSAAIRWLMENEPFNREWYAGPVGRIYWHGAEFCVGIRSALVEENLVHAYTGAGIVRHSQPAAEWNELEIKLQTILNALSLPNIDARYKLKYF